MYERCAALDWPNEIEATEEQKWLSQVPLGSFVVATDQRPIEFRSRLVNTAHPTFIGY